MTFNFSTDIFTSATGKRMAGEIRKVLGAAIADRHMGISRMLDNAQEIDMSSRDTEPSESRNDLPDTSSLVTIQAPPATGERAYPLFCIHPVGGNVFSYMPMGRHFGPQQPLYGLQSVGIDGDQEPLTSVEAMARHYVNLVRSVQPKGPYHLFGWSFGGVVSYEMARLLKAEGENIPLLAMVDSFVPTEHKYQVFKSDPDDSTLVGYLVDHLEGMFGCALKVRRADLAKMEREEQLKHVLDRAHQEGILPGSFDVPQMNRFFRVYKTNHLAFCRYQAQPYDGAIQLFTPKKQLFVLSRANIHAWNRLTEGQVNVTTIPGDHYTVMQNANAAAMAGQLRDQICKNGKREGAS